MPFQFPDTPNFTGFNEPRRVEAIIDNLVVTGTIPPGLEGALFRNGPDPRFPPLAGDDVNWNGDGLVTKWHFIDGHVDFRCRYVRTEKYKRESESRAALFGAYRNPFTDDPSVAGVDRTTANTSVYMLGERLLAVKEDGLPYELDPHTLETVGVSRFGGTLQSQTTSAHPIFDPDSGELFSIGYEARGLASKDVSIHRVSPSGQLYQEDFITLPYVSFIHDWGLSAEHIIVPVMPTTTSLDYLESRSGSRWVFDSSLETHFAIVHRDDSISKVRWFRGPASGAATHFLNAYTEGSKVHLDGFFSVSNPFPYIPNADGTPFDRELGTPQFARWTFDLASGDDSFEVDVMFPGLFMEMPVVDPRWKTKKHRYGFAVSVDRTRKPITQGTLGLGWNTIIKMDLDNRQLERYYVGDDTTCQEPVFVPRNPQAEEADGWLLVVLTRDTGQGIVTELIILDTSDIQAGPVATVHMPIRLHSQIHGTWVAQNRLGSRRAA